MFFLCGRNRRIYPQINFTLKRHLLCRYDKESELAVAGIYCLNMAFTINLNQPQHFSQSRIPIPFFPHRIQLSFLFDLAQLNKLYL